MPLQDYDTPEAWDNAYSPVNARVQSRADYHDYEWLQPEHLRPPIWGAIETRQTDPIIRRQKKIIFSVDPLAWDVHRYGFQDLPEHAYARRDGILLAFPIPEAERILVVGCGTGALVEAFRAIGYSECWGLEPSAFIQGNTARMWDYTLVVNESINGNQLKQRLRQVTGDDEFHWIIDEEMMEGYTDAELQAIEVQPSTRFVDLPELILYDTEPQSQIIHLVDPDGDPEFVNVHTMAEWAAFDPDHSWIDTATIDP